VQHIPGLLESRHQGLTNIHKEETKVINNSRIFLALHCNSQIQIVRTIYYISLAIIFLFEEVELNEFFRGGVMKRMEQ